MAQAWSLIRVGSHRLVLVPAQPIVPTRADAGRRGRDAAIPPGRQSPHRRPIRRQPLLGRLASEVHFWPFLPAPLRTGRETYRFIRLSGFLVSLTLVLGGESHHDVFCRAVYSCVFLIS